MDDLEVQQRQRALVELLKQNGTLRTREVEEAFLTVHRHRFLPNETLERAYSDVAIAVKQSDDGRWTSSSSQPSMMAIMLDQLELRPGMRVLEIGAGSGFNAALMDALVGSEGQVTSIDIQPDLVEAARANLQAAGFPQVRVLAADGGFGYPEDAPYDRIILTVGSSIITPAWREQLAPGGRLVLPLELGTQKSIAFEKRGEALHSLSVTDCGFMVLQGAFARPEPVRTVIGADPQLYMLSPGPLPIEAGTLAAWLEQPVQDEPVDITISVHELWAGLGTWKLQYEAPEWMEATLHAEGEFAGREDFPRLYGIQFGENKTALSLWQLDAQGAAALVHAPGQPSPFIDVNPSGGDDRSPNARFTLAVRRYGEGQASVQRLRRMVEEWDRAGRPGSRTMQVRAIPAEQTVRAGEGEILVNRPFTQFLIRY